MRALKHILWAGLFYFLAISNAYCEHSKPVYLIGYEDLEYYPYFTAKRGNADRGLILAITDLFAKSSGLTFEYVQLPISRFNSWFEQDHIDFRLPDNPIWHNSDSELQFSDSFVEFKTELIVLKDKADWREEQFSTVGILLGFTPSTHWQARVKTGELQVVSDRSIQILIRMLYNESIDGLDLSHVVVNHYLRNLNLDPTKVTEAKNVPSYKIDYRLSTKKHADVLLQFNQFLVQYSDDINTLKKQYLSQ